VLEGMILDDR